MFVIAGKTTDNNGMSYCKCLLSLALLYQTPQPWLQRLIVHQLLLKTCHPTFQMFAS